MSNVLVSGMTRNQENSLKTAVGDDVGVDIIARLTAQVPPASSLSSNVNNSIPVFANQSDWTKVVDGNSIGLLTEEKIKAFFEEELSLANKHIHILREEGITFPIELVQFDSDDYEAVIKSVKGPHVPLPGLSQILLKQACDFMQYLKDTGRDVKDEYLLRDVIKNHAVQFKAIKYQNTAKDSLTGLPKFGKSTDILGWLNRVEKTLRKLIGQDHTPIAYIIRENEAVPDTNDDLIPEKCYSLMHGSLIEELVNRKYHSSLCVEADKVTLYDHLDRALTGGPLELALQEHEDTKNGQDVMDAIVRQYGGKGKWEKAHALLLIASKKSWRSTDNITLTDHIAFCRATVSRITKACKHTTNTPPTSREQVLTLLGSIETSASLLQACITQINGDPNRKGNIFEETATHLMLDDPVENHRENQTNKSRASILSSLAGRGSTVLDLGWYPNSVFWKLSDYQRNKLMKWRKTPNGEAAIKKYLEEAKKKRKSNYRNTNQNGRGGGSPSKRQMRSVRFEKAVVNSAHSQAENIVAAEVEQYTEEEKGEVKLD